MEAVLEADMGILPHWGRGERASRACFRGSGSKVVRGNPQLQKATLLSPSHAYGRPREFAGPLPDKVFQGKCFSSVPGSSYALTA